MAMDKIIKPEEQEYISPLISFSDFKEVLFQFLLSY